MSQSAPRLQSALGDGYGRYVIERLGGLGVEPADFEPAIERGSELLDAALDALFASPAEEQRSTPLEVFRAALAPVTAALGGAGVTERDRDPAQRSVAPDDPYDLFPASPREISEEAWEASIAWGVEKAARLSRPLLVAVTTNLMDRGPFEAAAARLGYRFEAVSPGRVGLVRPLVAFVDLELDGSDAAIAALVAAGVRVVAYGPHVDSFSLTRAMSLGAVAAEPRSRVLRDPSAYLSPVV